MGLALTTVLAGGVAAYAYPPQSPLEVIADPHADGSVLITVNNANPNCDIRIRVDGGGEKTVPTNGSTTVTATFTGVTGDRDHDVRVRTVNCAKGTDKEHARTEFVIPNAQATGPSTAQAGKLYRVDVTGIPAGEQVTAMATGPGGVMSDDVRPDTANGRGHATVRVRLTTPGSWSVVVVTQDGDQLDPIIVQVS